MRREDKQITNINELKQILEQNIVGRLAVCSDDVPHIIPMNFGYELNEDKFVFYFHCATEGQKLDILKKNNNACFEVDGSHEFLEDELDCKCSMAYESIIALGKVYFVDDMSGKMHGMNSVVSHVRGGNNIPNVKEDALDRVVILKLVADEVTGKRYKRKQ